MIEKIKQQPIELYLGLIACVAGAISNDNTLLLMSVVFLGTSRILLEMRK